MIVAVDTYLFMPIIMLCWGAINDFVSSKEGIIIFVVLHDYFGQNILAEKQKFQEDRTISQEKILGSLKK
jgi:positive regulator of sigma E activity